MGEFSNVEDRLEIAALNQRYALHVDFHEIEEWVSLFTPDAVFDESEFDNPLMNGHDEIRAYGNHLTEIVRHVLHHMTTHHITDMTATTARGRAFALIEAVLNDGTHARTHCIYEDRYEKIDGRWLIAERILRKTIEPETIAISSPTAS
ncbi:nuclear transport factor 2 family protein [Sphingobium sp. AN558]|uniref:nuclear transport factor 2 family protein n=1 Tax=Sphingobium sp. AN558 TaxID=3133442 RepID=UPI0030C2D4A3